MKNTFVIIGLAALLGSGCVTYSSKMNNISLGMTQAEVIKALGEPLNIAADADATYLNYAFVEKFGSQYTPYEIKLVGGKVASYGRAGATPSSQVVPIVTPMPIIR